MVSGASSPFEGRNAVFGRHLILPRMYVQRETEWKEGSRRGGTPREHGGERLSLTVGAANNLIRSVNHSVV